MLFVFHLFVVNVLLLSTTAQAQKIESGNQTSKYTITERDAFDKFKSMLQNDLYNKMKTDEYLFRFLIDQNFDLEKAKKKLLKSLTWRKENNIDLLENKDFRTLRKLYPFFLDAIDRDGRPVLLIDYGKVSMRKIVLQGNQMDHHHVTFMLQEYCHRAVEKQQHAGNQIGDAIVIMDFNGFSYREQGCISCIPLYIKMVITLESYYPRIFHEVIGFNTPKIVERFYDLLRPFMSENLSKGLNLFGYDKSIWKPRILKFIDETQLSVQFGGTKSQKFKLNSI